LDTEAKRVVVVDDFVTNKPVGLVSKMDIVRALFQWGEIFPQNLKHVPVGHVMSPQVLTARSNERVFDAITKAMKNRFTGIAIVDNDDMMTAVLSLSDLVGLTADNFHHLLRMSVGQFLHETKKALLKMPVIVKYEDHFEQAVKLMYQNHVHRVFVLDKGGKPIGVLSPTDVLEFLARKEHHQDA